VGGTGTTSNQLPKVGGTGTTSNQLPKVGGTGTTSNQLPKVGGTGTTSNQLPKVGGTGTTANQLPKVGGTGASAAKLSPVTSMPTRPAGRFASAFGDDEKTQVDRLMGRPRPTAPPQGPRLTPAELTAVAARFDGKRPSPSVEIPAAQLKPLEVEASSVPGDRHALLTRAVLDQFAPETNSRYAEGECGHVFVWDFTRAMGCATPRWKRNIELTMEQVCAWFRSLSNAEGWIRVAATRAIELGKAGNPVIAMPKTAGLPLLAVLRPDDVDPEGAPLLASACSRKRGNRMTSREAFGQRHADFFFHP
jgi:hypothetical protein